jgi:hypothetical protein
MQSAWLFRYDTERIDDELSNISYVAVKEEIRRYSSQYSAHPNGLVVNLMEQPDNRTPAK